MLFRGPSFSLQVVSLCAALFVCVGVLFNYEVNWTHPELSGQFMMNALESGPSFTWADLARAWDWESFCGGPRSRVLSTMVLIANVKWRHWLWQFLPPHPSVSLVWFTSLFVPFFFFLFMKNFTRCRQTAWISTLLLIVSTGFLSTFAMNFHPGKPLSLFWVSLCLYVGSTIFPKWEEKVSQVRWRYVGLLFLLFLGFFIDETAWFAWVVFPFLYPKVFFNRKHFFWAHYVAPFGIFLLVLSLAFPSMATAFGYAGFPFWEYAVGNNRELSSFHYHRYFQNAYLFFRSQFFNTGNLTVDFIGNLVFYGAFFFILRSIPVAKRATLKRWAVVVCVYVLFQTLLMTKHLHLLRSPYYYGVVSSLLVAMGLGLLFQNMGPRLRKVQSAFLVLLLTVFGLSFIQTNERWKQGHVRFYRERFPEVAAQVQSHTRFSFRLASELWQARMNPPVLWEKAKHVPILYFSVPWELSQQNRGWETLDAESVRARFGAKRFVPRFFSTASPEVRASMAASLLDQREEYSGKYVDDLVQALGPGDSHCFRSGTLVYSLEAECANGKDKLKLAFLLSNVNQDVNLRVQKVTVIRDCCHPLWELPEPESSKLARWP